MEMMEEPPPLMLLTISEAAVRMSVGRSTLYKLVMSGEIPSIKIGKARRIPLTALQDYVSKLVEEGGEDAAR